MPPRQQSQDGRRSGPQLPFSMRQKLGLPQQNKRQRTQVAERKQKRQDVRSERNGFKRRKIIREAVSESVFKRNKASADPDEADLELELDDDDDEEEEEEEEEEDIEVLDIDLAEDNDEDEQSDSSVDPKPITSISPRQPSSISVNPAYHHPDPDDDSDDLSRGSREYSPEVVLDPYSKTYVDRQAEEDAEILALEKRLGVRGKTIDHGFDDILTGVHVPTASKQPMSAEREWLKQKRRKAVSDKPDVIPQEEADEEHSEARSRSDLEDAVDFAGFDDNLDSAIEDNSDSGRSLHQLPRPKPARENPYIAPVPQHATSTPKYIPPSRRRLLESDSENLTGLRRQAQGSLNKLSEANIISIVDEFEKLYLTNPRQDVTTVLIDLLITAFTNPSALQNTFIILHAAFIAALYKILGPDFAAELISRLVEALENNATLPSQGKESLNLISLLANLFTFGVISSALVYDYIRLLLSSFGENSAELLLRVIRDCGPQLRSDDPTALKGIVQMMNDISAQMTSNGQTINVRTRVMMDAIADLKNNKTRQATNAVGFTGEHLTRMRKALGSLNTRQLRATEPLGVTRHDILNSDKKGKWWLVGASWKGRGEEKKENDALSTKNVTNESASSMPAHEEALDDDNLSIDYASLARHYRFTTPTHRAIFTAVLSATDAYDGFARLSKLRLTRKQELEIARVLLRICAAESTYNPYYAVLSRLLLQDGKRYKFSFEVALWKFFEQIGEKSDDNDDMNSFDEVDSETKVHEIINVARMYASLVHRGSLSLDIVKTLNIGMTKENATLWLEMMFISLFTQPKVTDEKTLQVFAQVRSDMAISISYFLRKNVRKSDLVTNKQEKRKVKEGCELAIALLSGKDLRRSAGLPT